ncbi:MAG: SDR family oxidoreductase [Alphaproteobacteria bacterium]|nr:SDR family oxidoreductase [Alphaproteobacteria bacterium]
MASDRFALDGRVALVTGGAGILGRRFCRGLAEHGAAVAIVDIDADGAKRLADEISRETGRRTLPVACDLREPDQVRRMTETVVSALGRIDVLHNNAAGKSSDLDAFFAPFEDYSLKQWREIMAVDLDAMFLVAQAVGKHMVARGGGGSVIQTASIYGVVAADQRIYEGSEYGGRAINTPAVYAAAKAGVLGLTRHLAAYWAPHRIRVNALTPGGVESGQNETFRQRYAARVPLARMANPDEMVGALVYLASDASSYVTGQNIVVDGGLTAW